MSELNVPKELTDHIREEAAKNGYCVVNVAHKGGGPFHVEIAIDKDGGITLDECGAFNRKLTSWVDENQLFLKGYVVDVCSPGLDRELKSRSEFEWARGKRVILVVREPVGGRGELTGTLVSGGATEPVVVRDDEDRVFSVEMCNVLKARLKVTTRNRTEMK
ncbi:MAG: hypothetical protein PHT95_05515 [Candidatus Omnitrophica bacterium]|nr:hypothetical protein [Candidatus Omnitrophota bacterium]MDD4012575.1 hypothetical protein [Candidatus Omnitrophota bacterium]